MSTFADYIAQVKWRVDRAGHTQFSNTQIAYQLNEGFRTVYTLFNDAPFAQTKTTINATSATTAYSLPANCQEIIRLVASASTVVARVRPMTPASEIETYGYYVQGVDTSGSQTIVLVPSFTNRLHLFYYKRPPTYTTATATVAFPPEEYCDVAVLYASMRCLNFNEDLKTYNTFRSEYEQRLVRLRAQQWKQRDYDQRIPMDTWTTVNNDREVTDS